MLGKVSRWIKNNHQVLSLLSVVAAFVTIWISLLSFIESAEQFREQLNEQKRATSVAIVSDFISGVGGDLIHGSQESQGGEKFERLVITRAELLIDTIQYPELINQIVYFMGTNELGDLFDMTRHMEKSLLFHFPTWI